MSTIRLKTHQHRLIANLRSAFNPRSMLGGLLQNARRAQASHIHITVEGGTLTVSVNDRYVCEDHEDHEGEQDRGNGDAQTPRTFIAAGCPQDTTQVVDALLPDSLRDTPQPTLAGTSVRLVFDNDGKLQAITA